MPATWGLRKLLPGLLVAARPRLRCWEAALAPAALTRRLPPLPARPGPGPGEGRPLRGRRRGPCAPRRDAPHRHHRLREPAHLFALLCFYQELNFRGLDFCQVTGPLRHPLRALSALATFRLRQAAARTTLTSEQSRGAERGPLSRPRRGCQGPGGCHQGSLCRSLRAASLREGHCPAARQPRGGVPPAGPPGEAEALTSVAPNTRV